MTLPYERTNSVLNAEKFLEELLDPKKTPRVPKIIRDRARGILRHYPSQYDLHMTHIGYGQTLVGFVSECPFGDPVAFKK